MPDNAEKLISMGLERFGQLSTAEVKLFRAAANGEVAEFRVGNGALNHPAYANQWGDDRWLQADRIAWLCGISNTENLLTERGILISGAKISGPLRLDYMVVNVPLAFSHCAFSDAICLQHAKARMLEFQLTHCKSINADGIQVDGLVRLRYGFQALGMISLHGAKINGDFECEYSRVFNPSEDAIRAIGLDVKGQVSLSYSNILGRVHLYQAKIGGNLDCYNTKIWNPGGGALLATGIDIGGTIFLSGIFATKGFVAIGTVNLNFATIGGNLDCENGHFVHRPKIEDKDAQVSALDLQCTNVKGYALLRNGFQSDGSVNLVNAMVGAHLDCQGGRFLNPGGYAILGNNARISNGLILRNGFYAEGEVRLLAATIGGNFECGSGQFVNPKGNALNAERVEVAGHLLLQKSFLARGTVNLTGATIGGSLECSGGQFFRPLQTPASANPSGNALDAERVDVAGHLLLKDSFLAEGTVNLIGAKIAGNLQCSAGHFSNPKGVAINADGARVDGFVFLDKQFEAQGQVRLFGISVGFSLDCQGARCLNEAQDALFAPNAKVGGSVLLCNDFLANGKVTLFAAKIRGSLVCTACELQNEGRDALFATGAEIGDYVHLNIGFVSKGSVILDAMTIGKNLNCEGGHFYNPNGIALSAQLAKISGNVLMIQGFRVCGALNLYRAKVDGALKVFDVHWKDRITFFGLVSATVATLEHSIDGWPREGSLVLNGFGYDSLGNSFPRKLCLEWLRLQARELFSLQPYEQLAKVLKISGYDSEATAVLIAKHEDLRRHGDLGWWAKVRNYVLGFCIGHGYKPHRALWLVLVFLVSGWIVFKLGHDHGLMIQTKDLSKQAYPKFHALVYSAEFFVPIMDLRQRGYWAPTEKGGHAIVKCQISLRWGCLLTIYFWAQTFFGWVLTSLWVAGFTGLVRKLN